MHARLFIILAAAVSIALFTACGDDPASNPQASRTAAPAAATATPPAMPGAEYGGDDGFRAFARFLAAAIGEGDVAFITERYELGDTSCGQVDVGRNPYCTAFGHKYQGLPIGNWRSEGLLVPPEEVTALIQDRIDQQLPTAQDGFGYGGARIGAINVDPEGYAAVTTMLIPRPPDYDPGGPLRVAFGMSWRFDGERWRMTGGLNAGVLAEELLTPGLEVSPYRQLELFDARNDPSR